MKKRNIAITFLIPTYKGLKLLQQNLPSVMDEMVTGDELLISEDAAGNYDNLRYFRKKYNLQLVETNKVGQLYRARITYHGKAVTISFLQRAFNGRFARNVNDAVRQIESAYFLLLNNDVKLTPGVRDKLYKTMAKDDQIFAVSAREVDVNDGGRISGRNKIWWKKGRFWHNRDDDVDHSGETAWACGGSSLYDADKWEILGGFDTIYYPAYWEDIDVSWQAKRRGWKVVYCHKAVVEHAHETTNNDFFGKQKMEQMSWHGGTKFARKNSCGWQKFEFWLYNLYWQCKQFPALKLWLGVLIVALVSRLAFLDLPHGLTVDEAAIAYNGYAVWLNHRDEWLNFLPVTFRSFGDFKAPWAIYVVGLSEVLWGRNLIAIRLPFAFAGIASIYLLMLLTDLLLREKTQRHLELAAIAGALMTMSVWHWHFSHLGFENNWALFFQLLGGYLWLKNMSTPTDKRGIPWSQKWWSTEMFCCGMAWVLSMYSYHSAKLTTPLWLLIMLITGWREIWRRRQALILPILACALVALPLMQDSFCEVSEETPFSFFLWSQSVSGKPTWHGGFCGDGKFNGHGLGLTRGGSSFLTNKDLSFGEKTYLFGENMLAYFTPGFLWCGQLNEATIYKNSQAPNVRHGDGVDGVLGIVVLLLVGVLIATCVRYPRWRQQYGRVVVLGVLMVLIGTIPAAITDQIPHGVQAMAALPGWMLLATLGISAWQMWWRLHREYFAGSVMLVMTIAAVEAALMYRHYLSVFAPVAPAMATTGELKAMKDLEKRQKGASYLFAINLSDAFARASEQRQQVSQIIYAGSLEHPYVYALLAEGLTSEQYRYGKLSEKYLFVDKVNENEMAKSDVVVIYSPWDMDESLGREVAVWERWYCEQIETYAFGGQDNLRMCWTRENNSAPAEI